MDVRGGTWTCALTHVHSLSTWTLVVVRIVAVARDCRCRQGLSLSPGIVAVVRVGFSLGFSLCFSLGYTLVFSYSEGLSLSPGIVAVARDCRCRQGFSLSPGIVAVVRVGFSL